MLGNIFDSHAHYNDEQFDIDRDSMLASLPEAGVVGVINCGTDLKSSEKSLELAQKYDFVYAACGIHPEDIGENAQEEFSEIEKLLSKGKCVAIGEIGLDYHYDDVDRKKQLEVFSMQLAAAVRLDIPVIIHDREAHADTLELVKKYRPRGVLHCFSGSVETAREALSAGMYLGFGGALTFKNAVKPVEVVRYAPADRLLVETDCPYMSPVPFRGKRNNSSYIAYVAERAAQIKNCDTQKFLDITARNARRLFSLPQ